MLAGYSISVQKFLALSFPPVSFSPRFHTPILIIITIAIGLTLAWLPLKMVIILVGGAIFFVITLLKPILSLYLLIPVIPFSSLLAVSIGDVRAGLMEVVLLLSIAVWSLKVLASQSLPTSLTRLKGGPLWLLFLLFLGGVSLSWLNAFSIRASMVETFKWVEMLILYLFIVNMVPVRHIKWVVLILLLTGISQAILGLYQFIYKVGPPGFELFDGRFLRAFGTFAQPNPYGGYLGLLLPLALSLTLWSFSQIRGPFVAAPAYPFEMDFSSYQWGHKIFRFFYLLLRFTIISLPLGILLAALFASQSRGAWLGFAVAGVATLIVRSKKAALILATLVLVGASIGLIGSFDLSQRQTDSTEANSAYRVVTDRFVNALTSIVTITDVATTPVTDANFAAVERLAHWQAARDMWRDHPWLGVGFGNYAAIYPAYAVGRWLDPLGHAHNYLLNLGAETGLVGIFVYLIFWIFTFRLLWVAVRYSDGFHKAVAAGGFGIMVHLHVHNLVDNLYVQGMYLHIAIILGLVSIIYQQNKGSQIPLKTRK